MPYQGSPHCTPPSADRATFEAVNLHRRYGDTTAHRRPPPADHTPSEPLNFHGRHGDIKPNNILYFAQGGKEIQQGILKITDFGIARFTPENVALKRENGIVPNSPTYRSPECDFKNMEISSQCDMWALGCVYLVFLTWFFGGYGDVMEFAKSRQSPDLFWHNAFSDTFFTVDPDPKKFPRASVKASVIKVSTLLQVHGTHSLNAMQKINDLRSRTDCTKSFRMILDIIRDNMIIVIGEGAKANESSDCPHRRWSAGSVRTRLETIIHEAQGPERQNDYKSEESPRPRKISSHSIIPTSTP